MTFFYPWNYQWSGGVTPNRRQPLLSYLTLPSVAILKTGPCFPIRLLSRCAPAARPAKHLISAEFLPPHLTASPLRVCCHLGAYCSRHHAPGLENPFPLEARESIGRESKWKHFGACDPVGAGQAGARFSYPGWLWSFCHGYNMRQGLTHHPGGPGQAPEPVCSQNPSRSHQPPGLLQSFIWLQISGCQGWTEPTKQHYRCPSCRNSN